MRSLQLFLSASLLSMSLFNLTPSLAQDNSTRQSRPQPIPITPVLQDSGKATFLVQAPNATSVRLTGSDIPGLGQQGRELTRDDSGRWSTTLENLKPGAYRYRFDIDGVAVMDPTNPATSESNMNTWSLFHVPGAEWMDTQEVPHGAVAEVTYYSKSLERNRRMHVYTPPGYEEGDQTYPVFYLLHGAFDCDDSWTTVGRAGFILDNLIAAGKAKPMIVVMPAGHTGPFSFGGRLPMDEFVTDFAKDIKPLIERRYRVLKGRENTAIAGLSMGGAHTLDIAIKALDQFAYIGVYSSGVFGINREGQGPAWEEVHAEVLKDDKLKQGLELVWFATGKEDFLLETTEATVAALKKHGFDVIYEETEGGHTWENWREYLNEFTPMLFQGSKS